MTISESLCCIGLSLAYEGALEICEIIGVVGKVGDEGDEELTASVETDRVGLESVCALVEGLDELEHGAGIGMVDELSEGEDGGQRRGYLVDGLDDRRGWAGNGPDHR